MLNDKQEKTYQDSDRKEGLDYITKSYKVALSNIQNAEKKLKGAQNKAKVIINKVSESSSIMDEAATMRMYFSEDSSETTDADKAQEASKQEAVRNYFTINSSVVTAVMNILEMGFNKHFKFLHELAKLNGAQPLQKKEDNENNTGNNQNNEQQGNNA